MVEPHGVRRHVCHTPAMRLEVLLLLLVGFPLVVWAGVSLLRRR
jgi:hypothetical protein